MKTSNILILVLVGFIAAVTIYDKAKLREISENLDRSVPFGEYVNTEKVIFSHVVVNGNNLGEVSFHQRGKDLIKYNDHLKGKFTHKVNNDTLYLSFDKELTANETGNNNLKRLVVFYDTIRSLKFTNSNIYMWANKLNTLKIEGKGVSFLRLHAMKLDSLKYNSNGRIKTKFDHADPSNIKNLLINASGNSKVYLKNVISDNPQLNTTENAKIDEEDFLNTKE